MKSPLLNLLGLLPLAAGVAPGASAAVIDSIMTSNGDWHVAGNWSPAQVPNNGADTYNVSLPSGRSVDLSADATVTDLTTGGSVTFNNASSRLLTVQGTLTHDAGTFTVQTALGLVLQGTAVFSGDLDLRNGAGLINEGSLVLGAIASFTAPQSATFADDFDNSGTVTVNAPGNFNLNNFKTRNTGTFEVQANTFSSGTSYRQESGSSIVHAGASIASNSLQLVGGTVSGEGTYQGSSFSLGDGDAGALVTPGMSGGDVGVLTFAGNMGAVGGATLSFDLNGTGQGTTYDQLVIQNGANMNGVALEVTLGFTPSGSDAFDIITGNNLANGTFLNEAGGRISFAEGSFAVTHGQNFIRLDDFIAVPEPAAWAPVAALGLLGLAGWRRGRRTA